MSIKLSAAVAVAMVLATVTVRVRLVVAGWAVLDLVNLLRP